MCSQRDRVWFILDGIPLWASCCSICPVIKCRLSRKFPLSAWSSIYLSVCWLSVCFFLSYSPPVYLSQLVSRGLKKMFLKTGWQHTDMVHISQCQAPTYTVTCSTISIWIILQGQINTFKWFLVAKYVTWVEIFFTPALLFYQRKADNTH